MNAERGEVVDPTGRHLTTDHGAPRVVLAVDQDHKGPCIVDGDAGTKLGGRLWLVQLADRLQHARCDRVGVSICIGSTVFEIAAPRIRDAAGDANARGSVSGSVLELAERAGLVVAGKALFVFVTVHREMFVDFYRSSRRRLRLR